MKTKKPLVIFIILICSISFSPSLFALGKTVLIHSGKDNLLDLGYTFTFLEYFLEKKEQGDNLVISSILNLEEIDMLIIFTPEESYTSSEKENIKNFVKNGGSLLLLGEHRYFAKYVNTLFYLNNLASEFGLSFREDVATRDDSLKGNWHWIELSPSLPLFRNRTVDEEDELVELIFYSASGVDLLTPNGKSLIEVEKSYPFDFFTSVSSSSANLEESDFFENFSPPSLIPYSAPQGASSQETRSENSLLTFSGIVPFGNGFVVGIGDLSWLADTDPDGNGKASLYELSNAYFFQSLLDYQFPSAVDSVDGTGLQASQHFSQISFSWSPSPDTFVSGYQVTYQFEEREFGKFVTEEAAVLKHNMNGGTVWAQVQTDNGLHLSLPAFTNSITLPSTPEPVLSSGDGILSLEWDRVEGVEEYNLYVSSSPGIDIERPETYQEKITGLYSSHTYQGENAVPVYFALTSQSGEEETFPIREKKGAPYALGDLNGDGKVNSSDSLLILQILNNLRKSSDSIFNTDYRGKIDRNEDGRINSFDNGDVNNDGFVDEGDAHFILEHIELRPTS